MKSVVVNVLEHHARTTKVMLRNEGFDSPPFRASMNAKLES